jgi:hypothetical protein
MIFELGDIWERFGPYKNVVMVTTNLGWNRDGKAIMGAGIALDAAKRFPDILDWYGSQCQLRAKNPEMADRIQFAPYDVVRSQSILGFFPTKTLDRKNPHLSWKQDSSLDLIERTTIVLRERCLHYWRTCQVFMPWPGCGNGNLTKKQVKPILMKHLGKLDNVTVMEPEQD